ncbi:PREDICTED: F-box only protein 36-like [Charadrius vociferus]|uniref:F-box only protein 36-like n=1 Tax=Charadrius vociferus TaxID=50402 RepID=UPI000521C738|nr:PREDICTED: F-box only protein 36-like [Charadrius vociferus]
MVSLLQETLHELHCQSPPPSKDFHRFAITSTEVESIFPEEGQAAFWVSQGRCEEGVVLRISFQPTQEKVLPKEVKKLHAEFLLDQQLQKLVKNVFGNSTLEYTINLCQGHYDFLIRMPESIIIHILSFLDAGDLQQLSNTCKKFQQMAGFAMLTIHTFGPFRINAGNRGQQRNCRQQEEQCCLTTATAGEMSHRPPQTL